MNAERSQTQLEETLRDAVRGFAISAGTRSLAPSNMSMLIQATAGLPLASLAHWEQLIRSEFSLVQHAISEEKKNGGYASLPFSVSRSKVAPARFLNWLDLTSFDGYVRERTVRTLTGQAPNSFFFALAVRRLNDWVAQVRLAARQTVPSLARTSNPEHVVDALCAMLPAWASWTRMDAMDRQAITEIIGIEQVAESLKRRVISSPAGPMSAVVSQCMRTTILDRHLTEIAAKAIQPAVRARAYRALFTGKAVWVEARHWKWKDFMYRQRHMHHVLGERPLEVRPALLELMHAAAADRSCVVRRVAAQMLIKEMDQLGDGVLQWAQQFAGDASPPVAERGVFALKQLKANAR